MEKEKKKRSKTKKQHTQEADTSLEESIPEPPVLDELLDLEVAKGDGDGVSRTHEEPAKSEIVELISGTESEGQHLNEGDIVKFSAPLVTPIGIGTNINEETADEATAAATTSSLSRVNSAVEATSLDQDNATPFSTLYPQQDLAQELANLQMEQMDRSYCEIGSEVIVIPSAPAASAAAESSTNREVLGYEYEIPVQMQSESRILSHFERPRTTTNISLLYNNYLLENNEEFIKSFIATTQTTSTSLDGFELYELLTNNLRAWTKLTGCEKSLAGLKDSCDDLEKCIWTLTTQTLTEKSFCEDGSPVTATYKIHTSEFNQTVFNQLRRTLKEIRELIQDSISLHTYSVQLTKIQIEHFFYKSFGSFPLDLECLHLNQEELATVRALLQKCLTTLFTFIRKPLLHPSFITDCRGWIEKCAGSLLRLATIEDHLFLLNHVLRCPPRMISKWGARLVQVPPIPIPRDPSDYFMSAGGGGFGHLHLDYALAMLNTMLSPVPKREEYLSQQQISSKISAAAVAGSPPDPDSSQAWVIVDSDGEDEGGAEGEDVTTFKEADLVTLLQQVPFESIFKRLLLTWVTEDGTEIHDIQLYSEHSLMKLIAFAVHFVEILSRGFTTYYTDRYRQLVKLLGRLILHTVQYVTDQVETYFSSKSPPPDQEFLTSLAAEYDAFMYGAVASLYNARNVGTSQFLAAIPYQLVSEHMTWELYHLLTKWDAFEECLLRNENISPDFEHELLAISESNAVYMLSTLSAMAMCQKKEESTSTNTFIRIVTLHLFQIGFLSPVTKDACSKHVRDLIGSLTREFPWLISVLIQKVSMNMTVLDKMSLFLLKDLAFDLWIPSDPDISLLSHWLLNFSPSTLENQLGRFIIQEMNWDLHLSSNNQSDAGLFLPYRLHCQIAILVVKAHLKWEHGQSKVAESVKQLSSWISKTPPDLTSWAWEMIRRLHLHVYDRFALNERCSFADMTKDLPSLEGSRDLEPLRRAIEEQNPIGCTIALLMTPLGHSVPLLCDNGFELLETVVQASKYDMLIRVLYYTVPIFIESSSTLVETEKFLPLIKSIAAADATYLRLAKNLVVTDPIGPVTKLFGQMLTAQLDQFPKFGIQESDLISLWMDVLTKLENWSKDNSILYWLDVIAKFAYPRPELKSLFHQKIAQLYKDLPSSNTSSGGLSSWFGWSSAATTLLPNPSYPQFGYLTYFVLTIETELENCTGFWKSILTSLGNPKISVETATKKACHSTKFVSSPNYLLIYRWAQQALDSPSDHPLVLIFWQKFFSRYFQRISSPSDSSSRDGVGERFFEGMINSAFLKKLKKRLHELLEIYTQKIEELESRSKNENQNESASENVGLLLETQKSYLTLASAMALWIEDPKFHKDSLYVPALPPQCQPQKLNSLIEGELEDWADVVDTESILATEKSECKEFLICLNRLEWTSGGSTTRRMGGLRWQNSFTSRQDELLKRLSSYDEPSPPPPMERFSQILPELNSLGLLDSEMMWSELKPHFETLNSFAKSFKLQISQHTALDCSYCDSLPELYTSVESEALVRARCAGTGKRGVGGCSGPAHVVFQFIETRLNERVGHAIHQNRTEYHDLIQTKGTSPPPSTICAAAVCIEDFITNLILTYRKLSRDGSNGQESQDSSNPLATIGSSLFYHIVAQITEDTTFYPPTRQLYSSFLEILGHEFISGRPALETRRLVSTCIQKSSGGGGSATTTGLLAPHINLIACDPTTLLEIYKEIVGISRNDPDLVFVLLSKLDLSSWLIKVRPTINERSQLLALIWKALEVDGAGGADAAGEQRQQQNPSMVQDTYRSHLKILLLHDFPQHFGEILNLLLEATNNQTCDPGLWFVFFNALSKDQIVFQSGMESFVKKRELRRFATEFDGLRYSEVLEVANLLSSHFKSARLSHGIYGVYPKYRVFLEPIGTFLQMIAHLITATCLKNSQGLLSHKVIESVWPIIRDLYSPWILPYDEKIIRHSCAQWIQRMNFEPGAVLQPFVRADESWAMTMMSDFTDSILFLAETVPGSTTLFSNLWTFYVDHYAHQTTTEHVLTVVHNCFISIPWSIFWPSTTDLESMNRIVLQYLPTCHSFLSVVFAQISWLDWIKSLGSGGTHNQNQNSANLTVLLSKSHFYLLNITVNLSNDVLARESPTWIAVMESVQRLDWEYVNSSSLEQILNFYVMSIDPRVVLDLDSGHHMDKSCFTLLKIASGYSCLHSNSHSYHQNQHFHNANLSPISPTRQRQQVPSDKSDLNRKRWLWTRTVVRLILSVSTKYKPLVTSHTKDFERALCTILDELVVIVQKENQSLEDFKLHLKEIMALLTNHYLATITRNAMIGWCETNARRSVAVPGPIFIGIVQLSFEISVAPFVIAPLLEIVIERAFKSGANWATISALYTTARHKDEWSNYAELASKDGHFLLLNLLLLARFQQLCDGGMTSLTVLTELMKNMKPREENEAKLPLIYKTYIRIVLHFISELNNLPQPSSSSLEKGIKKFLAMFTQHLGVLADERQGSWAILGALGLTKAPQQISFRGRLLTRSLQLFLQAHLPPNTPIRVLAEADVHFSSGSSTSEPTTTATLSLRPTNPEVLPNLEKLEAMKLDRLCTTELSEAIDVVVNLIKEATTTSTPGGLGGFESFVNEISSRIFTESYLA